MNLHDDDNGSNVTGFHEETDWLVIFCFLAGIIVFSTLFYWIGNPFIYAFSGGIVVWVISNTIKQ